MASSGDFLPTTSQIPGLSNVPPMDDDEKRKHYIRDTDSDYVRLAKQGGTKNLLSIQTPQDHTDAVDYPKSEWFGHHAMEDAEQQKILKERHWQAPDFMTHESTPAGSKETLPSNDNRASDKFHTLTATEERMLIQAKYNNREVPFQTDNLSYWERKEEKPRRGKK